MEQLAIKMLKDSPELGKEFAEKKTADTAFAKSPQQILNWFYNLSPYADSRKGIYPVAKVSDKKLLEALLKSSSK